MYHCHYWALTEGEQETTVITEVPTNDILYAYTTEHAEDKEKYEKRQNSM